MIRKKQILFLIFIMAAVLLTPADKRRMPEALLWMKTSAHLLLTITELQLDYAKEFAVDYYNDGLALITISDGSRFLVVPQKEEAPDDLDSDIVVLKQPVDHIYLVASATMDMFRSLDALDAISLSGTKKDGWYIDEARQAMDNGSILYAGNTAHRTMSRS